MAEWLLRKKILTQNLETLLVPKRFQDFGEHRSPLLRDLQTGNERVKKLSRVFEEKSSTFNLKTNWWLDFDDTTKCGRKKDDEDSWPQPLPNTASPPLITKPRLSLSRSLNDLTALKDEKSKKISMIVDELLQKERTYQQSLERGIENYVKVIRRGRSSVPEKLRRQTFSLFGNIEEIYELHHTSVYPRLSICGGSVEKIAETISSLVQNDYFYCYIVYAINQKSAEQIISAHQQYFGNLCIKNNDYLGINSFIILPVQKLPRYKLFLDAIIKEYNKSYPVDKDAMTACCVAEKHVSNLLRRLDESLLINDIVETHEFPAAVQLGLIASVEKDMGRNQEGDKPLLFLKPRTSSDDNFKALVS